MSTPAIPSAQPAPSAEGARRTDRLGHLPEPAYRERYPGPDNTELVCEYFTDHQVREYARQEVYAAEERWSVPATPPSPSAEPATDVPFTTCPKCEGSGLVHQHDAVNAILASQPSREVLTEAEIQRVADQLWEEGHISALSIDTVRIFARAIESALIAKQGGANHG